MNNLLKIGHRGAKGHVAENTLASFAKAFELGCNGIEFDVHLSADGEVIVIHDETVDRTTDGKGRVSDFSISQLRELSIDGTQKISTLSEVIDATPTNSLINIELKIGTAAKPVMHLIEKYVAENKRNYADFLVSSFNWIALKEIRQANEKIPLGVLTETDLALAIGFSESIKAETLHPYFHLLTAENIAQMQSRNLKVFPWTVNEAEDISRMKSFCVDGIITDFPDRL
ncbi:MAG: glycerophosphodiester phosphodiesterase [Flavobacterium sp.]|nr:MAG: glycerophosphodiester phosphodiesterase [Flavobacterium sp.]